MIDGSKDDDDDTWKKIHLACEASGALMGTMFTLLNINYSIYIWHGTLGIPSLYSMQVMYYHALTEKNRVTQNFAYRIGGFVSAGILHVKMPMYM